MGKVILFMTDNVKKLFAQYEKAFNTLDVEKQVPLFAEYFISSMPGMGKL